MSTPKLSPDMEPVELERVPAEAIAALEDMRRRRAVLGLPGSVSLKIDDAPGKPMRWSIVLGEMVIPRGKFDR